jgi:RimJ/RimL family protein N-acetyltransferase
MHKLTAENYQLVRPLSKERSSSLFIDSVIDGNTPAWVYVDDIASPHTAFLWDLQTETAVAGDAHCAVANQALGSLISDQVIPSARARGLPGMALFYDTPDWEAQVNVILPGYTPEKVARRRYVSALPRVDWRTALPAGATVHRLDEQWLGRNDLGNIKQVVGWVDSFWHSHSEFAHTSFGFALTNGITVASWCLGVFASGSHIELGLATVPAYQRQGYATAVAARCVAYCVEHGLTPHWHCWEDNIASWRTAEKIGFADPIQYTVYRIEI